MKRLSKTIFATTACGLLALGLSAAPAAAKGCIKGAAVGALAGHVAGHGVLGAAGGCAVGHHMANRSERETNQQPYPQSSSQTYNRDRP